MITTTQEVYKCEFCKKKLFRKYSMELHEKICTYNPDNKRPCFDCRSLTKKEITIYSDTGYGEIERNVELLFCDKKGIFLHTPKNEIKGNVFDLGDESNNPMPKDCEVMTSIFTPSQNSNPNAW